MILEKYKDLAVPNGVELRDLPGFEDRYFAGSDGNIYSNIFHPHKPSPFRMLNRTGSRGYFYVKLSNYGIQYQTDIHVWVCKAFHGEKPTPLHEVRHLDGNKTNNNPDNLTWGTRKENSDDKRRHGTMVEGSKSFLAKFSDEDVVNIRYLRGIGEIKVAQLSKIYNVNKSVIYNILKRKSYKNVKSEN